MDKYNVIDQTSSIDDLEQDYYNWASLPIKFRRRADEECIRKNGCTNLEYYEKKKAALTNAPTLYESTEDDIYQQKVVESERLNTSPTIEIIIPKSSNTIEDLTAKYQRYMSLPHKFRIMSDEYSRQIWGYTVIDIYQQEKEVLSNVYPDFLPESYIEMEAFFKPVMDTIRHMAAVDDKIGLLMIKMHECVEIDEVTEALYESANYTIDQVVDQKMDFDSILPEYTPYFTPDEMVGNSYIESLDYTEWKKELLESVEESNTDKLLSLGWNPSVSFTESNREFARNRYKEWLEYSLPTIIDIQGISDRFAITESTVKMREYYEANNLYPVYIVLSFTDTFFGNVIRRVKSSKYTHAGLSLDSNLKDIYTFNYSSKFDGFGKESLATYISKSDNCIIDVLAIFVDKKTYDNIKKTLKDFEYYKTKYSFGNCINMLLNRAKETEFPQNIALVCSQFVDLVLKLSYINLFEKPNNLVLPQDFADIITAKRNPKVYRIYEGLGKEYSDARAERDMMVLFAKRKIENIRYPKAIKLDFQDIVKKAKLKETFNKIDNLLTPDCVITERYIPIRISDKGDLHIEYKHDLEEMYQETHKLLTSYNEDNIEGIKHELAKLFAMNSDIEQQVKKMKKNDPSYKDLMNLRARILNDFKKYMKVVVTAEKDFDFGKYFKESEYYNKSISIHSSTLKYSGALIKGFLRAQGF